MIVQYRICDYLKCYGGVKYIKVMACGSRIIFHFEGFIAEHIETKYGRFYHSAN